MARLIGAGNADGLGHIDTTQGEFRGQIDVVADSLLQLAGNADVGSGLDLNDLDPSTPPSSFTSTRISGATPLSLVRTTRLMMTAPPTRSCVVLSSSV